MKANYECLVIGAGPAGSTASALVAEGGFSTLLVEREKMPRFHVGESLMPEIYWTLQRLGLLEPMKSSPFVRKVGVQFASHTGTESQPFFFDEHDPRDCSKTWHVERADFDQMLYENAAEKGAECHDQTRVVDIRIRDQSPHEVTLETPEGQTQTVTTRVVVDATGQQALLANRMGLKIDNPQLHKASIWGYFRGARRKPVAEPEVTSILHTRGKRAWFWYIPLTDDIVSVGLVSDNDYLLKGRRDPQSVFDSEKETCLSLVERLAGSHQVGRLHVAREFSYSTRQQSGDGWVLVGDAGGFIDPIYSTGVFLALKSGEMAADCITAGLSVDDVTARQLGKWTAGYNSGVELFRKLVGAFYTAEFSFADFLKEYPQHKSSLTDLLIGRAFTDRAGRIFDDMDPVVQRAEAERLNKS